MLRGEIPDTIGFNEAAHQGLGIASLLLRLEEFQEEGDVGLGIKQSAL